MKTPPGCMPVSAVSVLFGGISRQAVHYMINRHDLAVVRKGGRIFLLVEEAENLRLRKKPRAKSNPKGATSEYNS